MPHCVSGFERISWYCDSMTSELSGLSTRKMVILVSVTGGTDHVVSLGAAVVGHAERAQLKEIAFVGQPCLRYRLAAAR